MGRRCVVAGCSNTNKDGVSLHTFPTNDKLCKQWVQFVKRRRDKWEGPSKHSTICSAHFGTECFANRIGLMVEFGLNPRKDLLPGSVPTIYAKRDRSPADVFNEAFVWNTPESGRPTKKKKMRTAAAKREKSRVLSELLEQNENADEVDENLDTHIVDHHANPNNVDQHLQADGEEIEVQTPPTRKSHLQDMMCQTDVIIHASHGVQVKPKSRDQCFQAHFKANIRSIGIQCNLNKSDREVGIQCSLKTDEKDITSRVCTSNNELESDIESDADNETDDESEYEPWSSSSDSWSSFSSTNSNTSALGTRKFLVNEDCLLGLFELCRECGNKAQAKVTTVVGTFIQVESECYFCGQKFAWASQNYVGAIPEGNLSLSAAILFSGSIPTKVLRTLDFMNVPHIQYNTFMTHQRQYLQPAVLSVWRDFQTEYFSTVQQAGGSLEAGGDGRTDTPGHAAKFGSYTMLDLNQGVVFDVQLVQSNEVKSSCHMEKEGLIRAVELLNQQNISIKSTVTGRHIQINKWIRENLPDAQHFYDVWHVAKGLKKKLLALSNEKECELLGKWIKSICNHLYWCSSSTPNGDPDVMSDKWLSVSNHINNIHTGHPGSGFTACTHGPLKKKKWLKPGSKVSVKTENILCHKNLVRDVRRLSPVHQTSEVEAFHSTINQFAPKMIGFSYHGMQTRLLLAAMHFNENSCRPQATTKEGKPKYYFTFPKFKKGGYTLKEKKVAATFGYVEELLDCVSNRVRDVEVPSPCPAPPPLASNYSRPTKCEAVKEFMSRYCNVRKETPV